MISSANRVDGVTSLMGGRSPRFNVMTVAWAMALASSPRVKGSAGRKCRRSSFNMMPRKTSAWISLRAESPGM